MTESPTRNLPRCTSTERHEALGQADEEQTVVTYADFSQLSHGFQLSQVELPASDTNISIDHHAERSATPDDLPVAAEVFIVDDGMEATETVEEIVSNSEQEWRVAGEEQEEEDGGPVRTMSAMDLLAAVTEEEVVELSSQTLEDLSDTEVGTR